MRSSRPRREFRAESFPSTRDWVHFCVEFDLVICHCCRSRSRLRIGAPRDWACRECQSARPRAPLPIHPDLWRALTSGEETAADCPICRTSVPLRKLWISEDARSLYCREHLKPIETTDRLTAARDQLRRATIGSTSADQTWLQLAQHLRGNRCGRCPFNGRAIYDRGQLVAWERDRTTCTSVPDALNCANLDH